MTPGLAANEVTVTVTVSSGDGLLTYCPIIQVSCLQCTDQLESARPPFLNYELPFCGACCSNGLHNKTWCTPEMMLPDYGVGGRYSLGRLEHINRAESQIRSEAVWWNVYSDRCLIPICARPQNKRKSLFSTRCLGVASSKAPKLNILALKPTTIYNTVRTSHRTVILPLYSVPKGVGIQTTSSEHSKRDLTATVPAM